MWCSKRSALSLGVTLALSGQVMAEQTPEVIEVMGTPLSASEVVVNSDTIERDIANSMSDIFSSNAEINVGGGSPVSQKVYVRGLEDTMLNVTIDGVPQPAYLYHHQGRIAVEADLLQSVVVIPGAGRATNGPGALGGAIRFTTKEPAAMVSDGERFAGALKASYFSNTDGLETSISGAALLTDDIGVLASYQYNDHDDFEDGNGIPQPHTGSEEHVGFAKLVADISDSQTIKVGFDSRVDEAFRYHRPQWQESFKNQAINQEVKRRTSHIGYSLDTESPLLALSAVLYQNHVSLEHIEGPWGDYLGEVDSTGLDVRNASEIGDVILTYGVDWREDEGSLSSPIYGSDTDEGRVMGLYTQADWQLTSDWQISAGGRYDDYELTESKGTQLSHSGFSPNISTSYQLLTNLQVYAGYAEALRGAMVREIFRLDGPSSHPDREAEKAKNLELGVDYTWQNLRLSAQIYRTKIDNAVEISTGANGDRYLMNVGELDSKGYHLRAVYDWQQLSASIGYSHVRPELNDQPLNDDSKSLGTATGDNWVANLSWAFTDYLQAGYTGRFTERLTDVAEGYPEKPGYALHDIYLQWQPLANERLQLNLAVNNLFDKVYRDHASYGENNIVAKGTLDPGRDIRASLIWRF
ncbi:TonB-dependent receptor [Shewanella submarina]|uniref:TonB-dependent receptor domain-containing protein n=1 Tax=Shewanella submarina TaxID=2016376 RepID=A0ABV7GEI2_9GAMM|nr:TonB-dependent receptor [Shewanella submarina]MCL1037167.1 TonB-dependent receptor [Shewanella submarina]